MATITTTSYTVQSIQEVETFIRLSQRKLIIDKIADKCLLKAVLSRNAFMESVRAKKAWIIETMRREREQQERLEQAAMAVCEDDEEGEEVEDDLMNDVANRENDASSVAPTPTADVILVATPSAAAEAPAMMEQDGGEDKENTGTEAAAKERVRGEDFEEEVLSFGSIASPAAHHQQQQQQPRDTPVDDEAPLSRAASCSPSPHLRPSLSAPVLPPSSTGDRLKRCFSEGDHPVHQHHQQHQQQQHKKIKLAHHHLTCSCHPHLPSQTDSVALFAR